VCVQILEQERLIADMMSREVHWRNLVESYEIQTIQLENELRLTISNTARQNHMVDGRFQIVTYALHIVSSDVVRGVISSVSESQRESNAKRRARMDDLKILAKRMDTLRLSEKKKMRKQNEQMRYAMKDLQKREKRKRQELRDEMDDLRNRTKGKTSELFGELRELQMALREKRQEARQRQQQIDHLRDTLNRSQSREEPPLEPGSSVSSVISPQLKEIQTELKTLKTGASVTVEASPRIKRVPRRKNWKLFKINTKMSANPKDAVENTISVEKTIHIIDSVRILSLSTCLRLRHTAAISFFCLICSIAYFLSCIYTVFASCGRFASRGITHIWYAQQSSAGHCSCSPATYAGS